MVEVHRKSWLENFGTVLMMMSFVDWLMKDEDCSINNKTQPWA